MSDEADEVAADAQRLLDSDGPHLRKWMSDDPLNFIEAVHRVATAVHTPREAPRLEPEPKPAPPYISLEKKAQTLRTPGPAPRPSRKW